MSDDAFGDDTTGALDSNSSNHPENISVDTSLLSASDSNIESGKTSKRMHAGVRLLSDAQARGGDAKGSGGGSEVCRNYLNGICFRGKDCKYVHPEGCGACPDLREEVVFCRDYLNKGCRRANCVLVHATVTDSDAYHADGYVSEELAKAVAATTGQMTIFGRPVCKAFLNGSCTRGVACRFWHIDVSAERAKRQADLRDSGGCVRAPDASANRRPTGPSALRPPQLFARPQHLIRNDPYGQRSPARDYGVVYDDRTPDNKRIRYGDNGHATIADSRYMTGRLQPSAEEEEIASINEQNAALRRRIETLKQTMADMQAANEALLGENKRLRAKTVDGAAAAALNTAALTVAANALAPHAAPMAVAAAPGSAANAAAATAAHAAAEQHMAVVSLAAAAAQQAAPAAVVVHPSIAAVYTAASSDSLRWSLARM